MSQPDNIANDTTVTNLVGVTVQPVWSGLAGQSEQPLPANRPLPIQGPDRAWWVIAGKVDLFLVRLVDGVATGRRHQVACVPTGGLFLGLDFSRDCPDWQVLAVGGTQTLVVEVERLALHQALGQAQSAHLVLAGIEQWLLALCNGLENDLAPEDAVVLPRPVVRAASHAGEQVSVTLQPGQMGLVRAGVLWLSTLQGAPLLAGNPMWCLVPLAAPIALPRNSWLQATTEQAVLTLAADPVALLISDPDWGAVRRLQRLTLFRWVESIQALVQTDQQQMAQHRQTEARRLAGVFQALSDVLSHRPAAAPIDPNASALFKVFTLIGQHAGIVFTQPSAASRSTVQRDPLGDILRASQVRWRNVTLTGRWWLHDSGHLLAFDVEDGRPLALIARPGGAGYDIHDPTRQTVIRLDAERARCLKPSAKTFYRPLPATPLNVLALMRFASAGRQLDMTLIGMMALLIGLFGLVAPWVTGQLIDKVIPHADRPQLGLLAAGLMGAILATSVLGLSQAFGQLRLETRIDSDVQSAVWDRLLKLPTGFFREYAVVDLSLRANGITTIRQALSGSTMRTVLSSLFSLFALGLMVAQSVPLTLVGLVLVLIVVAISSVGSSLTLKHERALSEMLGRSSLLQLFGGIQKIRAAGAEARAFSQWARAQIRQQGAMQQIARIRNLVNAVNGVLPLLSTIVIFAGLSVWNIEPGLSTGQFLVFNAAFGMLMGSMLTLSQTVMGLLNLVPLYERAKPILEAAPEVDAAKADPGVLDGRIDLNDVVFGYDPDLPAVIQGVSLNIRAGEFVAIVGPSGCGKSTLLRLLLGFEQPQQGSIAYSDRDLCTVDITAVRRQLGVVLQNGQLMEGDIHSNIIGSRPLDKAAVDTAIDQSGLHDDIAAMPMGIHTVVADRGITLSGGQRQRLLIARAIVHKPRIVFLDEATSALDHQTQQHVMRSFEQLQATRVVIAHRLSTVLNADRILVMQAGRVVEQGTYAELMKLGGLFTNLAQRQIA